MIKTVFPHEVGENFVKILPEDIRSEYISGYLKKERCSMKNRLYALVMAAMVLFIPLAFHSHALSTSVSQLGNLSIEALLPSELSGDAVIYLPDPNFEAEVRRIVGKPTGDIIAFDLMEITVLGLRGINIADLAGIEYFTALEELYCSENQLTELDVSHNTMLTVLECDTNLLTTLDVGNNAVLEELICWGNQLTSLNMSGASALKWVNCSNNQLMTLDVSDNTALEFIYCYNNQLMSLNVNGATALEYLVCHDNRLTTLDVSHNPVLYSLACEGNRLTSLNVSGASALETLSCADNQLTTLNVSNNTVLIRLYCNNNLFSDKSAIIGLDESKLESFIFDPQGSQ